MSAVSRIDYPVTLPNGEQAAFTLHALGRYTERVRPHLTAWKDAHADAARLIGCCGELSGEHPPWKGDGHPDAPEAPEGTAWLLCGDVCFIVQPSVGAARWIVTTCFARGGISEAARAKRNAYKAQRRKHRRYKPNRKDSADARSRRRGQGPRE